MKTVIAFALLLALALPGASEARGALLLFGGKRQEVFLGYLNLPDWDKESVWNKEGEYGNKSFNEKSIWYTFSKYGGTFGEFSPFNRHAKHPPAIFDEEGKFLGYMTVNRDFPERTNIRLALVILEYWESIARDTPRFYELYFDSDDSFDQRRHKSRGRIARRR